MKAMLVRLGVVVALLAVWFGDSARAQDPGAMLSVEDQVWHQFRGAMPLHVQALAVSEPATDGTRMLIVSEPPPHVTMEELVRVDPASLSAGGTKQWTIGFDGWVKDAVFRLPPMEKPELQRLIGALSSYLYGTDYKAYALALPLNRSELVTRYPLDLNVRAAELESWYVSKAFTAQDGDKTLRLSEAGPGVYFSEQPGLVVWVTPKTAVETRKSDIRRFALDSDLILGAVARADTVAIFARERLTPVTVLPPLRTEMVLDLASAGAKPLAQSYERDLFGAGRAANKWDWAPIYLSPELIDSEYGSILNQTDQMLKSWTMCGLVSYYNFPCSLPGRMPFDRPLIEQLGGYSLLFNWNTTGFGLRSDDKEWSLYTVNRTGALPVIYRPDEGDVASPASQAVRQAEENAYSFYATLNEPLLARVVQYASLYQIFHEFGVRAQPPRQRPTWNQAAALRTVAEHALDTLENATPQQIDRAVKRLIVKAELPADEVAAVRDFAALKLTGLRQEYSAFVRTRGKQGRANVARLLAQTREAPVSLLALMATDARDLEMAETLAHGPLLKLCDIDELQALFSASRPVSETGWIRTPTVVFSMARGALSAGVGGHNLNFALTRIIRDGAQPAGLPRVNRVGQVICHPSDAVVLERAMRRLAQTPAIERAAAARVELVDPCDTALRSVLSAIARNENAATTTRGLCEQHLPLRGVEVPTPSSFPSPGARPRLAAAEPLPKWGPSEGASEQLVISQMAGKSTLTFTRSDGAPASVDVWNNRDLAFAIHSAWQSGGRKVDTEALSIAFDPTFTTDEARRVMENVRARLDPFGRKGRALIYRTAEAAHAIAEVEEASVKSIKVTVIKEGNGLSSFTIRGDIDTRSRAGDLKIVYDLVATAPRVCTEAQAGASVQRTVDRWIERKLKAVDVAPEIIEGLRRDLEGAKMQGELRLGEFGGVILVLDDDTDSPQRVIAAAEARP